MTLRVVIADDQPMMRAGFKAVLEASGDIQVVAEAATGEEAVQDRQFELGADHLEGEHCSTPRSRTGTLFLGHGVSFSQQYMVCPPYK